MFHYFDFIDTQYNNISHGTFVYDDYYRRATLIYCKDIVKNCRMTPIQMWNSIEAGEKQFGEKQMEKFIRSLVAPPEREGIHEMLRQAGIKSYSAVEIYVKLKGDVTKDTCRLVEIEKPADIDEETIFDNTIEYEEPINYDEIPLD